MNQRVNAIKEQLRNDIYEWSDLAPILTASVSNDVLVHRNAPLPEICDTREMSRANRLVGLVKTAKITVKGSGNWIFDVVSVGTEYFDSREDCDEFFCPEESRDEGVKFPVYVREKVSLGKAFDDCQVSVRANLDYYTKNDLIDELEKDLGHVVDRSKAIVTRQCLFESHRTGALVQVDVSMVGPRRRER